MIYEGSLLLILQKLYLKAILFIENDPILHLMRNV